MFGSFFFWNNLMKTISTGSTQKSQVRTLTTGTPQRPTEEQQHNLHLRHVGLTSRRRRREGGHRVADPWPHSPQWWSEPKPPPQLAHPITLQHPPGSPDPAHIRTQHSVNPQPLWRTEKVWTQSHTYSHTWIHTHTHPESTYLPVRSNTHIKGRHRSLRRLI